MEATVQITFREVYGETKAYPANDQARRLADLVGTKTLTARTMTAAAQMGFRVVEVDRFGREVGNVSVAA